MKIPLLTKRLLTLFALIWVSVLISWLLPSAAVPLALMAVIWSCLAVVFYHPPVSRG